MKRLVFLAVAAVSALCGFGETYLVEDTQGEIRKTIGGVEYTFSEFTPENFELIADSAWWYTDDTFKQSKIPVHIEDKPASQGGKISADIEASPNESAESLEGKIKAKIPVSAQGAYAAATKALAYSLYNKFRVDKLENQMKTVGDSLQTQLLSPYGITAETYHDDSGYSFKLINAEKDASGVNDLIETYKKGRSLFAKDKDGNVSIDGSKLIVEGKVALVGGGGGSYSFDGYAMTNYVGEFVIGDEKYTNLVALAGWYAGNGQVKKPAEDYICDYSLEDFGKEPDKRGENFNKHYLVTRDSTGKVHYLPMTNSVKAAVNLDNGSIKTNEAGEVALHSFTNGLRDAQFTLGEILTADKEGEPELSYWQTNAYLVTRTTETDGSYQLWYFPIGELPALNPDRKSIDISLIGNTSNKLEIAGFAAATNKASETAVGSAFADKLFSSTASDIKLPVKDGDKLSWLALGNYDINETASGLEASAVSNAQGLVERKFELANWAEVTNAAMTAYSSIADLMTGSDAEKAEIATNLAVLAKNLKTSKLEYILLGNMVTGTDNQSVTMTNKLDAATGKSNSVYTVYGFWDAAEGKVPMKVGKGDEAKLVWTNFVATASNAVDNLTIQNWRKAGETNDVLMVNGFARKAVDEKTLDTLLGDTKGTSRGNYKFQVLARKMTKDKSLDDSTNGLELVYLDIKDGLLGTNKWRKATDSVNRSDTRSYFDPAATNLTSGTEAVQGVALEANRMVDASSVNTNSTAKVQLEGFEEAGADTVPSKNKKGKLEWRKPKTYMGDGWEQQPSGNFIASIEDYDSIYGSHTNHLISVWGFRDSTTKVGYVPFVSQSPNYTKQISWTGTGNNDALLVLKKNADAVVLEGPNGVSADKPKVLQYNGNAIEWGDDLTKLVAGSGIKFTGTSTNIVEHNFVAGAGISILPAASGTSVTISAATPSAGSVVDPHAEEIVFITDVWYDNATHKIRGKRRTGRVMVVGSISDEVDIDIAICTPHSAEHAND